MTLIEALNCLKKKGITRLSGMGDVRDIDEYLKHAQRNHDSHVRYCNEPCHKSLLDYEDDSFIVETSDGHFIIATHYTDFDMATYSNYDTTKEAEMQFYEWEIAQKAAAIADKKVKQGSSISREDWILAATVILKNACKTSEEAFKRDFGEKI